MGKTLICGFAIVIAFGLTGIVSAAEPPKLIAHWPLAKDARDAVGKLHGEATLLEYGNDGRPCAKFNGRRSLIEVPHAETLNLGQRDFSLALWVKCELPMTNTLGDLVSKFDPDARRGLNFHLAGSAPAYSGMSDARHVHFGIDDGYLGEWEDHGQPWPSNSLITAMVAYQGELYAGIADADATDDKAKVFRFGGGKKWIDCGRISPEANHYSVQAMIVHNGKMYAGTGIYDWEQARGKLKGLPAAAPTHVAVCEGEAKWRDLGQVGTGSRVLALGSFNGDLYAGVDDYGGGHVYRYDEPNETWIDCGSPDQRNLESFLAYNGKLYISTHGNIYEYAGEQSWKKIGAEPHKINQIHSMHVAGGKMLLGTWPQGYVLRYGEKMDWEITGRLGLSEDQPLCNEVNGLTVYNGKLYAGVIPLAECYRYERDGEWTMLGRLAKRSDWKVDFLSSWLRLTCLTPCHGRLFASTGSCEGRAVDAKADDSLGRVYSIQAGQVVSHEHDIGGKWTHLAAVRAGRTLKLYVNGKLAATSDLRDGPAFNLSNDRPLLIGFGAQNYFTGAMADVRLYDGSLGDEVVADLAK